MRPDFHPSFLVFVLFSTPGNASFCRDDCQWLHIWIETIHNVSVSNCFTDTHTEDNKGTDCPESQITYVAPGTPSANWPAPAREVMSKAGVRDTMLFESHNDWSQSQYEQISHRQRQQLELLGQRIKARTPLVEERKWSNVHRPALKQRRYKWG